MTRHVLTTGAPLPQTLIVLLAVAAAVGCNAPSPEPPTVGGYESAPDDRVRGSATLR